ncbi:putative membrane protein [Ostertagia ostertagi]
MALLDRIAPPLFIFIWATGYIAAKLAAPYADPLTFLSWRYAGVVVLMLALALMARAPWPSPRSMVHLAVAGLGIQALYLGGVWVAIRQGLPAGTAALIVNLQPVLVAALAPLIGERVSPRQWVGVALGLAGVVLVIWHKLNLGAGFGPPLLLSVMALLAITGGTLYQKHFVPHFDLRTGQVGAVRCVAGADAAHGLVAGADAHRLERRRRLRDGVERVRADGRRHQPDVLHAAPRPRHGGQQHDVSRALCHLRDGVAAVRRHTRRTKPSPGMGVTLLGVYLVVARK